MAECSAGAPPWVRPRSPEVLGALDDDRLSVASATVARPSLDDVYLEYTGHTFVSNTGATTEENAA